MGLRFRKSISLFPGVRINFGKTGMSVSAGVPGFRKTFSTSGRVTTSVGIPGTGLYYVDTKNTRQSDAQRSSTTQQSSHNYAEKYEAPTSQDILDFSSVSHEQPTQTVTSIQLDIETLKSIHKMSDDAVDWTEVLVNATAPDNSYNQELWEYYHSMAPRVLSGDIDAYLQLIYEVNPLDDLLIYGSNFEFGTDDPRKIEVEFNVNESALSVMRSNMDIAKYRDLFEDFVCSVAIRISRDMFALLPIKNTIVHAVHDRKTILSVDFDRTTMSNIKFGFIDPSDTISKFKNHISFNA